MGERDPLVHPASALGVQLGRQLAAGQHDLPEVAVDRVSVGVHAHELVVLANGLDLLQRRLEGPVVPEAGVLERRRVLRDRRGGEGRFSAVVLHVPAGQPVGQAGHGDVVDDIRLLLGVLVRVDREPLDRLRIDDAEEQRETEPDGDPGEERRHPAGERARHEQGSHDAGHDGQGVEREETGGLVRIADARRDAVRAVDQLQLVQLVARRDGEKVEPGKRPEMDADRRREAAPAQRREDVASEREDERREKEAAGGRLQQPQKRQVEEVEADVPAEDGVDHRCRPGRGERDAVGVQRHRLPAPRQGAGRAERHEHGQDHDDHDAERPEVREIRRAQAGPDRPDPTRAVVVAAPEPAPACLAERVVAVRRTGRHRSCGRSGPAD